MEQRFKWARWLSGPVIAIAVAVIFVNLNVLPDASPVYDSVESYLLPVSMAMLLFRANISAIVKQSGKMFLCFNLSAIGTLIGVIIASYLFRNYIPESDRLAGILAGSYIGGGVNLFAVSSSVDISESLLSAEIVADNFVMAIVIVVLLWITSNKYFQKKYHHYELTLNTQRITEDENCVEKNISLLDIAMTLGTAFAVASLSAKLSDCFFVWITNSGVDNILTKMLITLLGNHYVILTLLGVTLSSLFPAYFERLKGAQEIGMFLTYLFFVVLGCPADLKYIIHNAPLLFLFCGLVAFVNIVWTLVLGKIFKQRLEDLVIASNANIGGPATAAAMAVAKGYDNLVVPAILVGLWGYIVGTPLGLLVAELFHAFLLQP